MILLKPDCPLAIRIIFGNNVMKRLELIDRHEQSLSEPKTQPNRLGSPRLVFARIRNIEQDLEHRIASSKLGMGDVLFRSRSKF